MELWPSSSASVGDRTLSARRRKQKGKEREAGWDVPIVHTGAISAGTLSRQEDGQYSWIFAQGNEVGVSHLVRVLHGTEVGRTKARYASSEANFAFVARAEQASLWYQF